MDLTEQLNKSKVTCRQDTGEANTQALHASVSTAVKKKALILPLAWQ